MGQNFKKVDLFDRLYVNNAEHYNNHIYHDMDLTRPPMSVKPYMRALVEELSVPEDTDYEPGLRILKVIESDDRFTDFGHMPGFGDIISSSLRNELEITDEELVECQFQTVDRCAVRHPHLQSRLALLQTERERRMCGERQGVARARPVGRTHHEVGHVGLRGHGKGESVASGPFVGQFFLVVKAAYG